MKGGARNPDAYTLVETLIAMTVSAAVLIPALSFFVIIVRNVSDSSTRLLNFTTSRIAVSSAASNIRAGVDVPELRTVSSGYTAVTTRRTQHGTPPTNMINVAVSDAGGICCTTSVTLFPPLTGQENDN
jgi:hypothetical protein